ncbi:P-type atpase, partial [Globisporangium splendens]
MTVAVRIDDHEIGAVALYEPLPPLLRLDALPFVFLYSTAAYLYCVRDDLVATLFAALIVFVHALAFLSGEWSVDVRAWMTCTHAREINGDDGTTRMLVKVLPSRATLPKQLCRCHVAEKPLQAGGETLVSGERIPVLWFSYQNLRFCINDGLDAINGRSKAASKDAPCFRRLDFPTHHTLRRYLTSTGYASSTDLALAGIKWGKNDFDIPIPLFAELLKEQLVAPFFVFQFFCMLLWCLDEYVYYSMLTLLMLVVFECTVVKQRQRNMETLNQMRRTPQRCLVYRAKSWTLVWSDELVPGDICSIGGHSMHTTPGASDDVGIPCDVLLLRGNCIVNESMLSGESIPLRKEAVGSGLDENELLETLHVDEGSNMQHKKHVLFGGTKLLQHSLEKGSSSKCKIPNPPDQGCVAFVLRTGFGTTQGSLVRTIIYSSQRVTANNSEAMWFILFLLGFAICASSFVLRQGLQDASRDRFKLLLHCIMIVTSVVPPELPMELSLAVTNSLIALTKFNIFCTEPFRIPFAGRIDICCFDKTGTLTSDELKMLGVVGLKTQHLEKNAKHQGELDVIAPEQLPLDTELVLAGCQSLVLLNGHVVGDPLELTAIQAIKWNLVYGASYAQGGSSVQPSFLSDRRGEIQSIDILHRFSFSSEHKRMSTIVSIVKGDNDEPEDRCILTKGAPEVLESLFAEKPAYYRSVYRHFASRGSRVLALGYRTVPADWTLTSLRQKSRHEVETGLTFAGFLVLESPLKDDTKRTIRDLMIAKHKVVMVTGDNALTACDVARQVGINAGYSKVPLILSATGKENVVEWIGIDDGTPDMEIETIPFDTATVGKLQVQYDLCVTGDALTALYKQQERGKTSSSNNNYNSRSSEENAVLEAFLQDLVKICLHINVFARTSPQQKEHIIMAMNRCGKTTAMCGDGTNDVGALKQAHIGISIVNSPSDENSRRELSSFTKTVGGRDQNAALHEKLQALHDDDVAHVVHLGDASIASPFTSRSSSVRVTKQLIRQGRCTLVTTIQMYKILGVNCLITAYYLSSLYLHGVKNGDQQLTVLGLGIAMFFLFLSHTKPAKKLSHERPPSGVFCRSVLVSILGQFAIHLAVLAGALRIAQPFINRADPSMHPDGKFTPNVVNSVMFLLSAVMQVNTFVANYKGQPFMESFWDNKLLSRSALLAYVILGVAVTEVFMPLNAMLELVPMPNAELQSALLGLMAADTGVTFLFEYVVQQIASS